MDIRSQSEFALFRLACAGLRPLPFRWSWRALRWAAWMTGPVSGLRREVVLSQLKAVFPDRTDPELADLMRQVYDHLAATAAEMLFADTEALFGSVRISPGWKVLDQALALGHGAIIATGHIGNFELGGRVLARRYPLLDVVKTQRNAPFDRYLQNKRLQFGIGTVPVDGSGRALLTHLQAGGLVTLLMDQDAGKTGLVTDFLGRPASTWPGAARISVRTGCPVVPMAILRNGDGSHTLHIGETLMPRGVTDTEDDLRDYTSRISSAVEGFIMAHPEQWFWVHRRWKGAEEAR